MAILWQDGFDEYNSNSDLANVYQTSQVGFSGTGGRFGGGAITGGNGGSGAGLTVVFDPSGIDDVWVSFAYLPLESAVSSPFCQFFNSSGNECNLFWNPETGAWSLNSGGSQTSLATWTAAMPIGQWHWIDMRLLSNSSSGTFEMWIDNQQVVSLSGLDTSATAGNTLTGIASLFGNNASGGRIDDLVIYGTTGGGLASRLGDARISTVDMTSDAGPNNGTPSTGTNHYACVDTTPGWNGGSEYLTITNTSGQEELFGTGSISTTPATVYSVRVVNWVEKSDAGAASGEAVCKSGGTSATGASTPLLTTYAQVDGIFETDPNTSSAWTYTAANAADVGFKVP